MISQRLVAHPASDRAAIVVRHQEANAVLTYVRFFKPRERYCLAPPVRPVVPTRVRAYFLEPLAVT
jgi:hypothetical protein